MALSFAGVPLTIPTSEVEAWIESHMSPRDVYEFVHPTLVEGLWQTGFPGNEISSVTQYRTNFYNKIEVGKLWWPTGASRWARAHYVVTDNQLAEIRNQCYGENVSTGLIETTARPLKFSQTGDDLSVYMYLLPPRRLSGIVAANGLHLITLVDERYYWWFRSGERLHVTEGVTTWEDLYQDLASILEITITVDDIHEDYLVPSWDFETRFQDLPLLLDAIAHNVGQRIVRSTLGTVQAMNLDTSTDILEDNLTNIPLQYQIQTRARRWCGGEFRFGSETIGDKDYVAIMPESVKFVFPICANGDLGGSVFTEEIFLTDITGFANFLGHPGYKYFRDTLLARKNNASDVDVTNVANLDALAARFAENYYLYLYRAKHDITYTGIADWEPEGLSDYIEWDYRLDRVTTHACRPEWNAGVEDLMHGPGNCSQVAYSSGSGSGIPLQGKTCVNFLAPDCTTKSLHSDGKGNIWVLNSPCENPTGGGGAADCGTGFVDTSGFSPCDCSPKIWTFTISGITDGTCITCSEYNRTTTLTSDPNTFRWVDATFDPVCGDTWILVYGSGSYILYASMTSGGETVVYELDGALWNCNGPNTMTLAESAGNCAGWPTTVTLTAG